MSLIPHRLLVRVAHACRYVSGIPRDDEDDLFELPEQCRLDNYATLDGFANFADVRLAWNEQGIAFEVTVTGKQMPPLGDASRPRASDGASLWIDTRGDRTSHRASRTCHQFHFLAAGGGPDRDEPLFLQSKIHRALADAPLATASGVPFHLALRRGGYRITAFLPAAVLNGYDPDEFPRLGVYYAVHDGERGDQVLSVGGEFPYAEDPSLWAVLDLVK